MYAHVRGRRATLFLCMAAVATGCSSNGKDGTISGADSVFDPEIGAQVAHVSSTNDSAGLCSGGVIPAFPGAQGGGAAAVGGRGGAVLEVTTLADSGPGSLRAALDASGPRTVVFRVAGTIQVQSPLSIDNPFITVAGQTAPGGGIMISGEDIDLQPLSVGTHDVVLRYLKIRTGRGDSYQPGAGDVVSMGEGAPLYNVVIDHCSLSWGNDENVALWSDSAVIRDITVQNSIISEALDHDGHSTGMIVGSNTICEDIENISVHHNMFAHNDNRNPYLKVASQEVVNNIIFNWGWMATQIAGGVEVDIVSNIYRAGDDDRGRSEVVWRSDRVSCNEGPPGDPSIHMAGNIGPHNSDSSSDGWDTMLERAEAWGYPLPDRQLTRVTRDFQRTAPLDFADCPIAVDPVENLESVLLGDVGASHRLNGRGNWVWARDSVDKRIVQEYEDTYGWIILIEDDVGGFPTIATGNPYSDNDHDGMPNRWERDHGFNKNNASDGSQDRDGDGYTNLEEFLNGTQP